MGRKEEEWRAERRVESRGEGVEKERKEKGKEGKVDNVRQKKKNADFGL